ncbi:MAG: NAD-dependent epimerase/dehydratase family protein [Patescibacteria group bacterium]|nr:NAD-dependent epimerase/dehydratase family protein [Patescibacteria group bacterium]
MNLENKTILVTGGAGFIGSHLVDALLEKGAKVVVVDNLSTGKRENINLKAEFYELDMNDPNFEDVFKKERPEIVYMFGFNTNVPKSVEDPIFDSRSITGSLKTLEFSKQYGAKKVIFSSTGFVYGNTNNLPTKETEPVMPDNPYIISKFAVENYVQFYSHVFGLNCVIFRFATIFGPRQTGGAMADYIRSINVGKRAAIYGDGTKTRDYTYVGDVIRANLLALDYESDEKIIPIFNLGNSNEISLNVLYKKIADLLGKPEAVPEYNPDRPGEMLRNRLDNTKAKMYLGWQPVVNFEDGLKKTIEYFLKQQK